MPCTNFMRADGRRPMSGAVTPALVANTSRVTVRFATTWRLARLMALSKYATRASERDWFTADRLEGMMAAPEAVPPGGAAGAGGPGAARPGGGGAAPRGRGRAP